MFKYFSNKIVFNFFSKTNQPKEKKINKDIFKKKLFVVFIALLTKAGYYKGSFPEFLQQRTNYNWEREYKILTLFISW